MDREIFDEWLAETCQEIDNVERAIISGSVDMAAIRRLFHSVKGSAGFFGLQSVVSSAHEGETRLKKLDAVTVVEAMEFIRSLRDIIQNVTQEDFQCDTPNSSQDDSSPNDSSPNDSSPNDSSPNDSSQNNCAKGISIHSNIKNNLRMMHCLISTQQLDVFCDRFDALLTLCQHMQHKYPSNPDITNMYSHTQKLAFLINDMRLQPIRHAWYGLNKMVLNLSTQLGKQAKLQMSGTDVLIDKNLLEKIRDPIVQIVKNCLVHGIETPLEREKHGKTSVGLISIVTRQQHDLIHIKISDDGAGMEIGLDKKLASLGMDADRMTHQEKLSFIFRPGFSTYNKVDDLAGRGVGMDIVKQQITQLSGRISVTTQKGNGSSFEIYLPLSRMVIPCIVCKLGEHYLGVPQEHVLRVVKIDPAMVDTNTKYPVAKLEDASIPLIILSEIWNQANYPALEQQCIVITIQGFGIPIQDALYIDSLVSKPPPESIRSQLDCIQGLAYSPQEESIVYILNVGQLASRMPTCKSYLELTTLPKVDNANANISTLIISVQDQQFIGIPLKHIHMIDYIGQVKLHKRHDGLICAVYKNKVHMLHNPPDQLPKEAIKGMAKCIILKDGKIVLAQHVHDIHTCSADKEILIYKQKPVVMW